MDFKELQKKIKSKVFDSVYLLHGEEPYYIDQLVDLIESTVLMDHEKDFNQQIVYGKDADVLSLLGYVKQYPMMAEKRLVILKEAQDFKLLLELEPYFNEPVPSTIFVIAYKYKNIDARSKFFKLIQQQGTVFKSEKVKDYQLPDWISKLLKTKGFTHSSKVPHVLAESIGNDLSRISNEIDKLSIVLAEGAQIDETLVEKHIGISKEYNIFELNNAVAAKDLVKSMKIVHYFDANPKAGELVAVIPFLFKFFSQIMRLHFLQDKSREGIARALQVHPFVAGELLNSRNNYDPKKIAENIALLHEYDLKAKGVGAASESKVELMRELVIQLIT